MTRALLLLALSFCACLAGCASAGVSVAPAEGAPEMPASLPAGLPADSSRYVVLAVANPLESPGIRAGSSVRGYAEPPRYVVGSRAASAMSALMRTHSLREAASWPIPALGLHCAVFELPAGSSRDAVLEALAKDARVQLAQPLQDFTVHGGEGVQYNDPYVSLQRGFGDVGAARAHRSSVGKGVHIAVIDTGVDSAHPDLEGRLQGVRNLVDEQAADRDRHGTEVAGVIAAVGNNRQGIVGIAPQARLSVFKACWYPPGADATARCNSFTLAKALSAAIDSDAQIVNLSLGGPVDGLLERLLVHLQKQGRIVVAALPPDGQLRGFPAGVPGVIAVGVAGAAVLPPDVLTAPGRDVLTLQPGARYDFASGSSIAAAHVSGVVALLLSVAPQLDSRAIRELLVQGNLPTGKPVQVSADTALTALQSRQLAGR